MKKILVGFVLVCTVFLVSCNKVEKESDDGVVVSTSESESTDVEKQDTKIEVSKETKDSNETVSKPTSSEILDIYSSANVGNISRDLLTLKNENIDGGLDITIDTANGYVHSYFEGNYIIFENKTFDDNIVGVSLKYNYITQSREDADVESDSVQETPSEDELLSVFADNFMIEKHRLTAKDQNENGGFNISIEDFEAEVEVSISGNMVIYKIINFRGELVDTINYDYTTKVATVE